MAKLQTHYDNLQVAQSASAEVIRAAYRQLAQQWHPDKHQGDRARAGNVMRLINQAYEVLSDPEKRRQHDDWIAEQIRVDKSANEGRPKLEAAEPTPMDPWPSALTRHASMGVLIVLGSCVAIAGSRSLFGPTEIVPTVVGFGTAAALGHWWKRVESSSSAEKISSMTWALAACWAGFPLAIAIMAMGGVVFSNLRNPLWITGAVAAWFAIATAARAAFLPTLRPLPMLKLVGWAYLTAAGSTVTFAVIFQPEIFGIPSAPYAFARYIGILLGALLVGLPLSICSMAVAVGFAALTIMVSKEPIPKESYRPAFIVLASYAPVVGMIAYTFRLI